MKILMTGATGIVGLPTLKLFLEEGHNVYCVVREKNGETPTNRLIKSLGLTELPDNLIVLDGDITKPDFNLSMKDINLLTDTSIDVLFHCAALTKMEEKYHQQSMMINVEGTKHALNLGKKINISYFHYISTAYVANGGSNVYECNKQSAEYLVESSNIPYTISRLGIVIGDTSDGSISDFAGMYGFFLSAYRIVSKSNYEAILEAEAHEDATLNLVPVDWAAKILSFVTKKGPCNDILNIVDENPLSVETVYNYGFKALGIDRNTLTKRAIDIDSRSCSKYQRLFNLVIGILRPYSSKKFITSADTLKVHLKDDYIKSPPITYELLDKCLKYAVSATKS